MAVETFQALGLLLHAACNGFQAVLLVGQKVQLGLLLCQIVKKGDPVFTLLVELVQFLPQAGFLPGLFSHLVGVGKNLLGPIDFDLHLGFSFFGALGIETALFFEFIKRLSALGFQRRQAAKVAVFEPAKGLLLRGDFGVQVADVLMNFRTSFDQAIKSALLGGKDRLLLVSLGQFLVNVFKQSVQTPQGLFFVGFLFAYLLQVLLQAGQILKGFLHAPLAVGGLGDLCVQHRAHFAGLFPLAADVVDVEKFGHHAHDLASGVAGQRPCPLGTERPGEKQRRRPADLFDGLVIGAGLAVVKRSPQTILTHKQVGLLLLALGVDQQRRLVEFVAHLEDKLLVGFAPVALAVETKRGGRPAFGVAQFVGHKPVGMQVVEDGGFAHAIRPADRHQPLRHGIKVQCNFFKPHASTQALESFEGQ